MINLDICGSCMLIDAKEKFCFKSAKDKGAEKLYESYLLITNNNPMGLCEKSIRYLKAFVQYTPNECLRIIRRKENQQLTLSIWGDDYLYLISAIAAYHLDRNEKATGLNWAVKALDLVDHFAPTLDSSIRKEVLYNMVASSMICAYPKDFNQHASDNFILAWEFKRHRLYGFQTHFNENEIVH